MKMVKSLLIGAGLGISNETGVIEGTGLDISTDTIVEGCGGIEGSGLCIKGIEDVVI